MSSSAPTSSLRRILENRILQLSDDMEGLFAEARDRGRRESADQLNQAVRRIRQSAAFDELGATLIDAAARYAAGAALFRIEGRSALGERIRGVGEEAVQSFPGLEIPLDSAAALAGAVESRDPVVALTSPGQVTAEMVALAGHSPDGRVSIFPLMLRDQVAGLVYAWGTAEASALELLSQVASTVWAEISKPPRPVAPPPDLIAITPAPAQAAGVAPSRSWEQLPTEEQRLHLRAQRFARVHAADWRLNHRDAVQSGRLDRDLYQSLRRSIDAARAAFHEAFFVPCASMVDYLHLELVRTLANDNPELLGSDYPGPMVAEPRS